MTPKLMTPSATASSLVPKGEPEDRLLILGSAAAAMEDLNVSLEETRVLIVDDNPMNLELLRRMLMRLGVPKELISEGVDGIEAKELSVFCPFLPRV